MAGALVLFLGALRLTALQNHSYTNDDNYYELPRFWTNTGFCPMGNIDQKGIADALLLDSAMQMNLRHIAALPSGAVTHVRIHWLLELIRFIQFTQAGVPIYDFTDLDTFIMEMDDLGLLPVIEFMANPGNVFVKNPNRNDLLWEDFSYQVARHYLNILGAEKVLRWRFESWNEPDLINYNKLNLTVEGFFAPLFLPRGLTTAGHRPVNSLHFPLRGPAGIFKNPASHPLCWRVLEQCNLSFKYCPFDVITYHRKGNGTASEVLNLSDLLLKEIYHKFPALKQLPISNDEADPISGWSTPQALHEDVHYAVTLTAIVLEHWSARLQRPEFKQLETISHDNAFLSYHPHEFSQRTMLAHFRMNTTQPGYSQFIQKPVYAALGMLAKLAPLAADLEVIVAPNSAKLVLLKTTVADGEPLFLSWIALPQENTLDFSNYTLQRRLPFELCAEEVFAFVIETLEQHSTDPAWLWRQHGSPAYPNATLRELMRRNQTPKLHSTGLLQHAKLELDVGELQLPWMVLIRVCSNLVPLLKQPQQLIVTAVTHGEVLLTWREVFNSTRCLRGYEVWFQASDTPTQKWVFVSKEWQLPFPSFQFAPKNRRVNGFYKVRGVDIFKRNSKFSESVEYLEL